jgi:outer membrane protein
LKQELKLKPIDMIRTLFTHRAASLKRVLLIVSLSFLAVPMFSQKIAFVDTEYILKRIPAYEAAQEQLNQASAKWQQDVEAIYQEVAEMYKKYQSESVFLSAEMKVKREAAIVDREKEAKLLQQKYFGPEGELFVKRGALIKPIQDDIYSAISVIAADESYIAVFDKSSNVGILFSDTKLDISDNVLKQMGITQ